MKRPRRTARAEFASDGEWRAAVLAAGGWKCPPCGLLRRYPGSRWLEADHIIPRAQGGLSDLANGMVLCAYHHRLRTANQLMVDPAWLRPEQVEYLAAKGWVTWEQELSVPDTSLRLLSCGVKMVDVPGAQWEPRGRGWKHFLPMAASRG